MNKAFCEKTIECIESINQKTDLLEQASRLMTEMVNELNDKINIMAKEIDRIK
tara:strand:- start:561 stop:719 length:159 start_codon:yes stop_codon:yes gene_type:complete